MKYLVIYDSIFGNTEKIARAIGEELAKSGQGETLRVGEINPGHLEGLDLFIAGSPTRAFSATPAMKDFLKGLSSGSLKGVRAAVFDTRMDVKEVNNFFLTVMTGIFGYAAGMLKKLLAGKGARVAGPAGDFIVLASEGPLKDGEFERAAAWAGEIAAAGN